MSGIATLPNVTFSAKTTTKIMSTAKMTKATATEAMSSGSPPPPPPTKYVYQWFKANG